MHNVNLRRIDLNLLVIFDAIAKTRSVTIAADRLALSQPAVSHALGRLRTALDDPLFVRGRSGLALTPRATELIDPVHEVLDAIGQAIAPPCFDPRETQRTFRLGTTEYAALTVVPALIRILHAQAPHATFELPHLDERMVDRLENGTLDVAFWGTDPPPPPLASAELFRETQIGVMDRAHPLQERARKGLITLDDFLAYPHIRMTFGVSTLNSVDIALNDLKRERQVAVVTASFQGALAFLAGSNLILSVPSRVVSSLDSSLPVVGFKLPLPLSDYPYYALWHARNDKDLGFQWLRSVILEMDTAAPFPSH